MTDIIPDLARLIRAALAGRHDAFAYGTRVASAFQIAEDDTDAEAEARLRDGLGADLDREQLGTALSALEDAADYRREHRDGDCSDCAALPEGKLCGDHEVDEAVASMYDLLHDELQERQGRRPTPSLADRVTEILSASGYTDARLVFPGGFLVTGGPGYATTGSVVVSVPWADGTDAERRRLLLRFAEALREGGLWVAVRPRYLDVRARPGEARDAS